MSKNLKKLISVFAAIMMLVSVIVPAGILPTAAETESAEEVVTAPSAIPVTEYKLNNLTTTEGKTYLNEASYSFTVGTHMIMSFDYIIVNRSTGYNASPTGVFLFEEARSRGTYAVSDVDSTTTKGDVYLTGYGVSHFEEIYYAGKNGGVFRIFGTNDTDKNLYIWNFSLKDASTGVEIKPSADYLSDNVSTETTLADYSWYTDKNYTDNDPMVTLIDYTKYQSGWTGTSDFSQTNYRWNMFSAFWRSDIQGYSSTAPYATNVTDSDEDGAVWDDDVWNISFDYYTPIAHSTSSNRLVIVDVGSGISTTSGGDLTTSGGRGTYSATFKLTKNSGRTLVLRCTGHATKLYVWNMKVTLNGYEVTMKTGLSNTYSECGPSGDPQPLSSFPWAAEDFDPTTPVAKINFSNLDSSQLLTTSVLTSNVFYFNTNSVSHLAGGTTNDAGNYVYTLSFDYYLPKEMGIVVRGSGGQGYFRDTTTKDIFLQEGINHYEGTLATSTSGVRWAFSFLKNKSYTPTSFSDLYIWNVSYTNGTTTQGLNTAAATATNKMLSGTTTHEYTTLGSDAMQEILATGDKENITVLDFSACEPTEDKTEYTATLTYNQGTTQNKEYTISFDYYLPDAGANIALQYLNTTLDNDEPGATPVVATTSWLVQGRHKFVDSYTMGTGNMNDFLVRVRGNATLGKLYIWNVSVVMKDADEGGSDTNKTNFQYGEQWSSSSATISNITVSKADLADIEAIDNLGAQIRDGETADLRFVGAAEVDGVVYNHAAAADYSNATIVIDNVRYNVSEVGMVFARDAKLTDLPENALVVGGENVSQQVATKIQSPEYAAYMGVDGIVFTTVLTNIPTANQDETISLRSYVKYVDATGNDAYWYGEVISRGYMQYAG